MPFPLQQLEGKYEIIEKIAEGGMGAVYMVRHRLLEEVRVIKVTRPQLENQEEIKSRFLREAKIAVKMRHINIAQMYDFSMDQAGHSFIVMEYIDGVTLQDVLKRTGPPGVGLALEIAQQSLQALGYLHRKGIVHRDISPDNLMLSEDDVGDPSVKLIDLGIAKATGGESNLTATGLFLGKIKYASPEHFKSTEGVHVDQTSDLYSFGLVLYELLTGQHPISGSNWSELIAGHLFEPPRDFAITDPDNRIPEALRKVVFKSLAKSTDDRYADAKAFRKAVLHLQTSIPMDAEEFQRFIQLRDRDNAARRASREASPQDHHDQNLTAAQPPAAGQPTTAAPPTAVTHDRTRAVDGQVTPSPEPVGSSATVDERTQQRLGELLAGAQRLAQLHMHEEAKMQLKAALQLDPNNQTTSSLLAQIEDDQLTFQAITEAVESIEHLIASEEYDSAMEALDQAVGKLGEAEEFQVLRTRLEQLEAQRRFSAIKDLVEQAEELVAAGNPEEALAKFEGALELDPTNTVVKSHLAAAQHAVQALHEKRQREAAVAEASAAVEAVLKSGDFEGAQARLDEAVGQLGEADELQALRGRIQDQRSGAAAKLMWEAQKLAADGSHQDAIGKLQDALKLDPSNSEISNRLAEIQQAIRRHQEEQRRLAQISEAVAHAEAMLEQEKFDEAGTQIDAAIKRLGKADELVEIRQRVERAQRAATAVQRVHDGERLLAEGHHQQAIDAFQEAIGLDPDNGAAPARLEEAKQALQRLKEEEERAARVAQTVAKIEKLVARDKLDKALSEVDGAISQLGESEALQVLRARILEEKRQAERARLVEEAEGNLSKDEHEKAISALEKAHELDPSSTLVGARLDDARQALQRQKEKEQRAARVAKKVTEIEKLIETAKLGDALSRADKALAELGQADELGAVRDRILGLQSEHLAASVSGLVKNAEGFLSGGEHEKAITSLEEAFELDSESTVIGTRLEEAREALARHQEEQKRAARVPPIVQKVESLIKAGKLDPALEQIDQGVDQLGEVEELNALRVRILQLKEERRAIEVEGLVDEAEGLAEGGDNEGAVTRLEEALKLDLGNRVVRAQLARAKEALGQEAEDADKTQLAAQLELPEAESATILDQLPTPASDATIAVSKLPADDGEATLPAEDRTQFVEIPEETGPGEKTTFVDLGDQVAAAPATEAGPKAVADATLLDRVDAEAFRPEEPTEPVVVKPERAKVETAARVEPRPAVVPAREKPSAERKISWQIIAAAAAVVVVVVGLVLWQPWRGTVATEGTLVINAIPWAEVEQVLDAAGAAQELPSARYTPMSLTLLPGRYTISLKNPDTTEPIVVEVDVVVGKSARAPLAEFETLDATQVLEKYGL